MKEALGKDKLGVKVPEFPMPVDIVSAESREFTYILMSPWKDVVDLVKTEQFVTTFNTSEIFDYSCVYSSDQANGSLTLGLWKTKKEQIGKVKFNGMYCEVYKGTLNKKPALALVTPGREKFITLFTVN